MYFGYPKGQRLPDSADNFIDRVFEGVRITLFSRKSAELAGKDTDVGVIDVTIVNVGRVVAVFRSRKTLAIIPSAFRSFER